MCYLFSLLTYLLGIDAPMPESGIGTIVVRY